MVTKEELSDELNAILSSGELIKVDIDFTRMTKEDLEALLNVFRDPTLIIQLGVKSLRQKVRKDVFERPLKEFLDKPILQMIEQEKDEDRGPLGLGIIPAISKRIKGVQKT